jgi:anti-sigma factor RsiW
MTENIDRTLHESPEYRQEQLSAALDGMLAPEEQAALDAHLAGCETCARELEELRQVRMLLRAMPEPALPRSFLLPTEGEVIAPRSPVRSSQREPAGNVTPLRRPAHRLTRTFQVARWIGTIAAVLGMALFLGTLLPTLSQGGAANTSSAPSSALNGNHNPAAADRTATGETNPSSTKDLSNGGSQSGKAATATSSPTNPVYSSATPEITRTDNASGPTFGDILRAVALVLLFGGIVVATVSFVVARRV